jgi:hypothetical protein
MRPRPILLPDPGVAPRDISGRRSEAAPFAAEQGNRAAGIVPLARVLSRGSGGQRSWAQRSDFCPHSAHKSDQSAIRFAREAVAGHQAATRYCCTIRASL